MTKQTKQSEAKATKKGKKSVSRRDFLKTSTVGAGLAAAGVAATANAQDDGQDRQIPSIRIPKDFSDSVNQSPQPATFEGRGMTGAQVFAKVCKAENLAGLFCCPGNYTVINALAAEGIPCYGGRTEGAMCAAADGFSRVTGEVVATSGTEGPGFTNMIMEIAGANAARTPLLVLASNMRISGDDRELGIQQMYQQPLTEGIKKYGKRLITPNRVHEYSGYAFRQLKSGVPGPVHLDFPAEVASARFSESSDLVDYYDQTKYRTESRPHPSPADIRTAVEMIRTSERPLIIASVGVFQRKAWDALKEAAEKNDIVVVESGPSRGHFSDDHRLSANLAPDALMSADLVIFVGQYCMPSVGEYRFNPDVKSIRVHPVQEDLGRNWPLDLGIVSDEKAFLEALADGLPTRTRDAWATEVAAARQALQDSNDNLHAAGVKFSVDTNLIHPACIAKEMSDFFQGGQIDPKQTTIALGGWTFAKYTRRFMKALRPGQLSNGPYQYYAIGPDVGYTFGVGVAVQNGVGPQAPYQGAPVLGLTGDAGIAYTLMEFETLSKYKIPAVVVVYNNNAWGVWSIGSRSARSQHMYLFQENLRYDQMVGPLGARGEYVTSPEQLKDALARSYRIAAEDRISTLINCQAKKEFSSTREYPPGTPRNVEPGALSYSH